MVGPSMSAKGGIAAVVNQYYSAGLQNNVHLRYISTTVDGNAVVKMVSYLGGLIKFMTSIPWCEIVHVHMSKGSSFKRKRILVEIASTFKKRSILHLHSGAFYDFYMNSSERQKQVIRNTFYKADKVIVLADEWRETLANMFDETILGKIVVLHNAVTLPENPSPDYSNTQMIFLGNLSREKGVYDMLESIKLLKEKICDYFPVLHVCGGGTADNYVTRCIELGISDCVIFHGWINPQQKDELLRKCSVFLLPSYHEGLPMSMLEAMSYGLAVIVSEVGGIPSVVHNMDNGLLVQPGDIKCLTDAINMLLSNQEIKRRLGENALRSIRDGFDIRRNIDELVRIYTTVSP